MIFSRKKKIQQDRNAGLVFRWRGGNASNSGGLTFAVVLAAAIFAMGMLTFKVILGSQSPPSRYRAEVVYVVDVDPSLRWWLDRNSPNFNVWDDVLKNKSLYDVKDKMYDLIDSTKDQLLGWQEVDFDDERVGALTLYEHDKMILPSVMRHEIVPSNGGQKIERDMVWKYVLSSRQSERLPDALEYELDVTLLRQYLGKAIDFTISVDGKGNVVSCLPLQWNTDKEVKWIENLLHTLKFQPSDKDLELLVLNVAIREREVPK